MTLPGGFEPITESAPLVAELRERVERDGPITFRDFMDTALYHPRHGYYRTRAGVTSRGGDYVTSPEVHPIFGTLVARQLHELWQAMGSPTRFEVVEQGAGRGLLARDIMRAAASDAPFASALRYTIVEPAALLRNEQQRTLDEADIAPDAVTWRDDLPDAVEGVVLTNELLDAFPVHRVVRRGDELLEVYVTHDGARFADELRPLSAPAIAAYFDALGVLPGDGSYAEVNLAAPAWLRDVASSLTRGYVLTFDYGYEAAQLYAPWRRDGTLLCFAGQSASSDPYQRIGKQDITASIDFTTLRAAGEAAGLDTIATSDQSSFLVRLGIGEGVAQAAGEMEEYFARRSVVMALIDPARLGRVTVLLQGMGVPEARLTGFADD